MKNINHLYDDIIAKVPNAVVALILLILAFICASIVKNLALKTMDFMKVDKALDKAKVDGERKNGFKNFIAKIFYLITFALFVPGIFEKLGLVRVAEPVVNMMNKLLVYLPNLIAALVILIIGLFIAKTVKEILIPVFKKLNFDEYLKKIGFEVSEKTSIAEVIANVIYVIILIPVVIASLDALKIEAISAPAINMLNNVLMFMPRVVVAIAIIFVGKFIADMVQNLLEKVLVSIGTDKFASHALKVSNTKTTKDFSLAKVISYMIKYIIVILFLVEGINILKLQVLTNIGMDIIAYMPYAISSAIILGIALLTANYVEATITEKLPNNKATALILKVAIITIGVFVTVYQLGIAKGMVNAAFIIILSSFAVAFAIAFGLGGREFASHMLQRLEDKIDKKEVTNKKNKSK